MRNGERGQASIEHLGLIVLVMLVLLASAAIAEAAGAGLSNRITTAMQRALCAVGAQECPTLTREPCPTRRTARTTGLRVAVGWIRLGDDRALQIERRSDGTYVLSLMEGVRGGVGVSMGAGALMADASVMRGVDAARTFEVPDRRSAQALVARLRGERLPAAKTLVQGAHDLLSLRRADPAVSAYTLAGTAIGEASLTTGYRNLLEGGVDGKVQQQLGLRISTRQPRATAYLQLDGRVNAFFDLLPKVTLAQGRDQRGRLHPNDGETAAQLPGFGSQERAALASGTIALELAPGPRILGVTITGRTGDRHAQREVHARLDPRDPSVAAALSAWRRDPLSGAALAELGRAASTTASIDDRTFAIDEQGSTYGGQTGAGPALGLTYDRGLTTARLTSQRSRPAGGVWERRLDCEA